jgi:hypothetical protein
MEEEGFVRGSISDDELSNLYKLHSVVRYCNKEARLGNKDCIPNFGDKTHGETFTWKSEE